MSAQKRHAKMLAAFASASLLIAATVGISLAASSPDRSSHSRHTETVPVGSTLRIDRTEAFPGVGAQLSTPPRRALTVLSSTDVADKVVKFPILKTLGISRRPDSLRVVTYENALTTKNQAGATVPSVAPQTAWFAEYDNVTLPTIAAPAKYAGRPVPKQVANAKCQVYVAANASTGKIIDAFDFCGNPSPQVVSK